jgi:homoserine kinase
VRVTARVPATSANLGPGFDCFGLALDLCNEVTVDTDAEPGVSWEGEGADELPTDGTDMVSRAMHEAAGQQGSPLPALALHATNRIPLERGLGSSAAAAVAGVAIAHAILRAPRLAEPHETFAVATELEGHPDNAAAATYGGVVLVVEDVVRSLDPHPGLRPVLLVPEHLRLGTSDARGVLRDPVSRSDAVWSVAHGAALVVGLTRDPRFLPLAMRDRLHEEERLALLPEARAVRDQVSSLGAAICLSGSGPSLLAFEHDGSVVPPDVRPGWRVLRPGIRKAGVEVAVEA